MVKKGPFWKIKNKKFQSPPTQKKVSRFLFWRKKKKSPITTTYWLLVILPNSTLSVFNKKQQQKNQQNIQKQQKNTFYLIHSLFFWTLYNNSVFTISYFTSVLHYSLLFSWKKKLMFWPKRNKKTNLIITNKGTAFPKKKIIEFEKNKKMWIWFCEFVCNFYLIFVKK